MLCLLVRLEMPRKKRNFGRKTRARRSSAPAIHFRTNNRPSKRICWTDEGMVAAVKNGILVKRAAEEEATTTSNICELVVSTDSGQEGNGSLHPRSLVDHWDKLSLTLK